MSSIAATGGLGFIVGPLLGMSLGSLKPGIVECVCVSLPTPFDFILFYSFAFFNKTRGPFVLDFLTGPAYIAASLAIMNLILVIFFFSDARINKGMMQQLTQQAAEESLPSSK